MDIGLDPAKAVIALRRDGPALAAAGRAAGLEADVPSCPGWTVTDLLTHVGEVYAHKTAVIDGLLDGPPQQWATRAPGDDPYQFFEGQHAGLVAALRTHRPDVAVWTWYEPDRTVGFWARRMAQETVIHRADAELAGGEPHHVDAVVAVDGIDEFLERFVAYPLRDVRGTGQTLTVLTAGATWRLRLQPDRVDLDRDVPPQGDLIVAGTPSHVLYWLWGRQPDGVVDLRGDRSVAAVLRAALRRAGD